MYVCVDRHLCCKYFNEENVSPFISGELRESSAEFLQKVFWKLWKVPQKFLGSFRRISQIFLETYATVLDVVGIVVAISVFVKIRLIRV